MSDFGGFDFGSFGGGDLFGGNTMAALPEELPMSTGSPFASDAAIAGMGSSDPFAGNTIGDNPAGSWWDRNKGDIGKALGQLKGAAGGGAKDANASALQRPLQAQMAQSQAIPGRGPDLGTLLTLLQQRSNALMPGGSASGQQGYVRGGLLNL
jgi:hypothetical protein